MKNRILYSLCLVIYLYSCANQTAPTGGPKDEAPPVLIESIPEDQQVNFSGQQISLTFDELVQLKNARQAIIVTPRLDQEINYTSRRNKVLIEFTEPLEPNTTYSINFQDAIQDITEGNPVTLNFAFSTGSFIDSLRISGSVYDLLTDVPAENVLVALQQPMDTAYYFSKPALYFTKSDKDGTYAFTNLKSTNYRLYAFNDVNNDLILQPSKEKYGFIPEVIELTSDTSAINIPLVKVNTDTIKIISSRQSGKYFDVNYNKYIVSYDVSFGDVNLPYMLSEDFKSIRFFNISELTDSIPAFITAQDSIGLISEERVYIKYEPTIREPLPFTFTPDPVRILKSNPQVDTKVSFNKPISFVNTDSIYFFIDSLNIVPVTLENISFDSSRTVMNIRQSLDTELFIVPDKSPQEKAAEGIEAVTERKAPVKTKPPELYFGNAAFISVENDTSIQKSNTLTLYTDAQVGVLHVEVDVPFDSFIIELLKSNYQVISRKYDEKVLRFNDLLPGKYYLRVLQDSDNDQFWDVGNIYWNIPPEGVEYYINPEDGKDIEIRANWELGPYIVTGE